MAAPDEPIAWMALAELAARADPAPWHRLAASLGSAAAVFTAARAELAAAGLGERGIAAVRAGRALETAKVCRERCARAGVDIAWPTSPAYPRLLREIPDPPLVLYFRGRLPSAADPAIAVVGSRRATRYGRRTARHLARELAAAGVTVISGLAVGIDAAAHNGALQAGASAAVLAGGPEHASPRANRELYDALLSSGGILSENPPGTEPLPYRFPARNRLITGMSAAVVVVEAAERSGSLVSARLALEQGREIFAVPGNIDSPSSRGTNGLLRDGCAPLLDASDALAAIGVETTTAAIRPAIVEGRDPETTRVLAALESEPMHVDDVVETCGLDGARVLELLTTLELAGLAERCHGGLYCLSQRGVFAR